MIFVPRNTTKAYANLWEQLKDQEALHLDDSPPSITHAGTQPTLPAFSSPAELNFNWGICSGDAFSNLLDEVY